MSGRLKNYVLVKSQIGNAESRKLIGDDGSYWPFEVYINHLHTRDLSKSSRVNYASDIAYFIDYFTEASNAVASGLLRLDPFFINHLITIWPQFMLLNKEQRLKSENPILKILGKNLDHPKVNEATVSRRIAALNSFLGLSDRFHQVMKDREKYGEGTGIQFTDGMLLPDLSVREDLNVKQKQAMVSKSMLAGVISQGPKLAQAKALKRKTRAYVDKTKSALQINPLEKAFPPDRVEELIESANSYRDRAYLSLLAASGIRGHEARQILWEDINPIDRVVWIIPPWERRYTEKWQVLPVQIQEDIAWKGRETEATFLLEPYASMFFEYLASYRKNSDEWDEAIPHPFVFVKAKRYGFEPLLTASSDSINDIFKKAMRKLKGLPHYNYGAHSLRHMYGITLAWEVDRGDGRFGLPLAFVKELMGHANLASTEIYAKPKIEHILREFNKVNELKLKNKVDIIRLSEYIEKFRVSAPSVERNNFLENVGNDND